MADFLATLPLGKLLPPGRHGAETFDSIALCRLPVDACTLVAGRDRAAVIARAKSLGADLCDGPRRSAGENVAFVGVGPGRWLALSKLSGLAERLEAAFAPEASVFAQGGGVVVLEASSAATRAVLAKLVPLDLERFALGEAATTTAAHINLTLWRHHEDHWRFVVGRSYLAAFLRALAGAAAEYGLDWTG
jgi:sarcosine oxidase subunit gamma